MRRSTRAAPITAVTVLALALLPRLAAQDPTPELAASLLEALAPAADDPQAVVQQLLAAAFAAPRSPAAFVLSHEAEYRLDDIGSPQQLADWLAANRPTTPVHGLLATSLRRIEWRLLRNGAGAALDDPFTAYATHLAVLGPFGDAGRYGLDQPYPPDLGFPPLQQRLPGRFGEVSARIVVRKQDRDDIALQPPGLRRPGCYYTLWRVHAAATVAGFVEVVYRGPFLCRCDGVEVGRSDSYLAPKPGAVRMPVRLQPGEHRIVVKTGDDSDSQLGLRLIDAAGAALPQVTELDAASPPPTGLPTDDPRDAAVFRDGMTVFAEAAAAATGAARANLRIAAAWTASRTGEVDRTLELLEQLDREPPTEPTARLVLADLWLRTTQVPEEQRTARARALEADAIAAVPAAHHRAVLARVRELEEKDQREAALRLLRGEIDAKRAGPATFAAAHAVLRRLQFLAEEGPLLQQWADAVPTDLRPILQLADRLRNQGASARALVLLQAALARRPADDAVRRRAFDLALDLGDFAAARAIVDQTLPATGAPSLQLSRLQSLATLCHRAGDKEGLQQVLQQITSDDEADARTLAQCADRWLQLGLDQRALATAEASLERDPDQPAVRELCARLGGGPMPGADFARFRRDGDAAIAAFQPGPGENDASSTLVIDQRIVELLADGSCLSEIHELRRINDLQGVEALRTASDPAQADEVLLLRTIGKDGRTYMPTRVEGGFAMPRLEVGAFVEWRYRRRTRAPGAAPWRLEDFLFRSQQEPLRWSEWVLIAPVGCRGSLRQRNADRPAPTIPLERDRIAQVITSQDVARLPEESSPPPAEELIPVAGYGEDASPWPSLRLRRAQLLWRSRPTPPIAAFAKTLLADAADDRDRLARIHAFCQAEIEDGDASDATEVLLRRKGSRFILTVALLRAGAVPIEAAACERARRELTGQAEPLFADDNPAPTQCALLRPRDADPVWLFADTPRYWPLGTVPAHRLGALAFVIHATAVEQRRLPTGSASPRELAIRGTCSLDLQTTALRAEVRIGDFTGYAMAEQLRRRTADVQRIAARQIGQQLFPDWRIQTASLARLEPGGQPLHLDLELRRAAPQEAEAGRWLALLPMPTADLRKNFGDRDERTLPLLQQQDVLLHTHIVVDPGDGRSIADLPAPLLVSFALLDYQLTFARDDRRVVIDRYMRLLPGTIAPALYPDWIRWLAAIDQREQERLVVVPVGGAVR